MVQGQPGGATGAASGGPAVFPDVDMSHLSEEERLLIESVMAKAQMEELEPAKPANSRYDSVSFHVIVDW